MLSAPEVSARLASRAHDVCRYLLPHGKLEGGNWCVGSTAGEKGDSMRIQVSGSKAGLWADFAGNESGDLLDLWAAVKNVNLGVALKEAKQWLGVGDPVSTVPARKYARPAPKNIIRIRETPDTLVEKYLTGDRKLTRETVLAFLVGARKSPGDPSKMEVVYPSFEPPRKMLNGQMVDPRDLRLISVKYIGLDRTPEGKKIVTQEKDCAPCLFGWQAFELGTKAVVITEGQIDAMTWHQWGYPALSVPNGTGDTENWIDYEWDNLSFFETIYLSFDMDEVGEKAVMMVAKRLGIHRCKVVKLPHKDANDCLQKGCTWEDAKKWITESIAFTPQEIKRASDFRDQVHAQIRGDHGEEEIGLRTRIFGKRFRFRRGEVTLWTGHTSHGKSTLLNQIMAEALMAGERVAIGSFEVKGANTVKKLCHCIAFMGEELDIPSADQVINWMGEKLWIFDVVGIMKRERLFELMLYAIRRCGVVHFVIDSLMKCDLNSEDYEQQRVFLNQIIEFAGTYDVHIHVVGHPRKTKDDETPPGNLDIHGGQAVSAQPDNIVCVWRNKNKEKEREAGKLTDIKENTEADTVAFVNKQRLTGDEYKVRLWFKRSCHRFTTHFGEGQPTFEDFGIVKKGTP
jgi:twinkle protein